MKNITFNDSTALWLPQIESALQAYAKNTVLPNTLSHPIEYFMSIGGKRLRPLAAIAACHFYEGDINNILSTANAIEIFHNFSLVHDDIMDKAPTRRGHITVHEKWDIATGILCGDVMLIDAYHHLLNAPDFARTNLMNEFTSTAKYVCIGQAIDMEFEKGEMADSNTYIEMVRGKTASLLAFSLYAGAICAGQPSSEAKILHEFGMAAGTAFQIWDDWLDAFGNPEKTGKQLGGDILSGKQTILIIQLRSLLSPQDLLIFELHWKNRNRIGIMELMERYHISTLIKTEVEHYLNQAEMCIQKTSLSLLGKHYFMDFLHYMVNRAH